MKLAALPLAAVACAATLLSTPAAARDTKYMLPFADVLSMPEAQEELDGSVKVYLSAQGLALRNVVLDTTRTLARQSNSVGLPTTLFFAARGRLDDRRAGELSPATIAQRLEVLAGPPAAQASAVPAPGPSQ